MKSAILIVLLQASCLWSFAQGAAEGQSRDPGRESARHEAVTLAEDGAWTWFNDERMIVANGFLLTGYLGGTDGRASVAVREFGEAPGGDVVHVVKLSTFDAATRGLDDHNNPALLELEDGDVLAAYARHHKDAEWYARIGSSESGFRDWSGELAVPSADGARTTYNNLFQLENEGGRIYNFYRGKGFNPNVTWSEDRARTWSAPFELIRSGDERTRPYVKYCSDGKGRIDLLYTDGHPRKVANNIYHIYYENGWLHRSDGMRIRSLEDCRGKPLEPSEGTLVYEGSKHEKGRGWVWDLEYDAGGRPVAAYISVVEIDGGDLRYRLGRWDGRRWKEGEVAYAGEGLYVPENHYAGGIAIDPDDTGTIYVSTNVDPGTGLEKPDGRYQIYRGTSAGDGMRFTFEQLTFTPDEDNLRPVVPRDHGRGIFVAWFQGRYTSYKDFDCDIRAIIEK